MFEIKISRLRVFSEWRPLAVALTVISRCRNRPDQQVAVADPQHTDVVSFHSCRYLANGVWASTLSTLRIIISLACMFDLLIDVVNIDATEGYLFFLVDSAPGSISPCTVSRKAVTANELCIVSV